MANDLIVRILGDTKGLERSFAQANRSTVQFGRQVDSTAAKTDKVAKSFRNLGGAFAGGFVASEVLRGMKSAIDVASNLQEQISKTNVVFGRSADTIKDWAETTAGSIGIANDQALAAASTFGSMFDAAGATEAKAAAFSQTVVKLAADLASFNNTSVDDALTALRSGLSGEIEPLRRFQVFLTEASVAQQAMADTGKTSSDQLTQGEKILARYNLIMKQTVKQQGDFARTSEGLANQQRKLDAQMRDLQASIGGLLIPVMKTLVEETNRAIESTKSFFGFLGRLGSIEIPTISIPFVFEEQNSSGKKDTFTSGDAVAATVKFFAGIERAMLGISGFKPVSSEAITAGATAFDNAFNPFFEKTIEAVEKGSKKAEDVKKGIASFGEKGFKPLTKSVKQLREERNKVLEEMRRAAQERADAAAATLLAGLQLNIDRALLTKGLKDDLNALLAMQTGLQTLIKKGQDVQDNQARLVATIGAIADKRREIQEAAADALQARQFRAIGLSATGGEIIPGIDNIRKQFQQLSKTMVGEDVPRKLRDRMRLVGKFLKEGAKDASDETILAIRDLFREVRSTFDQESDKVTKGPLTKTTSLNASKILDGLGLGRDMEKELRARLSSFNSAGKALAGAQTRTTGGFRGTGTVVVENHNTINLDGDVVAKNTTKSQQRTGRVNPRQKRGPNSGI